MLTESQRKVICDCLQSRIMVLEDEAEGVGGGDYVHSIAMEIKEVQEIRQHFLPLARSKT